jgi:hypothetical protein
MKILSTLIGSILALVILSACGAAPGTVTPGPSATTASTGTPNYTAFSEREAVNEGLPSSAGDDPARLAASTSIAKNICSMLDLGTLPVDIEIDLANAGIPGNNAVEVQLAQGFVCPHAGS